MQATRTRTASGAKAYQRADGEYRAQPYSDWHRTLGRELLASDIDSIEWRLIDGEPVAVGVMELTRVDSQTASPSYLQAILDRYERDFQARAARRVAEALGCKAWVILFSQDCKRFWVYNLTDSRGWFKLGAKSMAVWLASL